MQVTVTKNDVDGKQDACGTSHPIARVLHRSLGSSWKMMRGNRAACEVFPPFRVITLPESVPLFMKAWRKKAVVPPFEFDILDEGTGSPQESIFNT